MVVAALVYALAGGTRFDSGDVIAIALVCAIAAGARALHRRQARRASRRWRSGPSAWTGSSELLAERAVAEERVRIAQELHDVIAHNVSLIVVQAQALGATHATSRSRAATDGIADLGRRTMAEMHRTLRLLRARDDAPEFAPAARGWATSTSCWRSRAPPGCPSSSRSRARRAGSRRASTCRRSGSCRRR